MDIKRWRNSGEGLRKRNHQEKDDTEIEHVWVQGFPIDETEDNAIQQTLDAVKKQGFKGDAVSVDVIHNDDLDANSEFQVRVVVGKVKNKGG